MASSIDYKTLRVESGRAQEAVDKLNAESDGRYYIVGTLDDNNEDVTTLLLSQGVPTFSVRDPDSANIHTRVLNNTADEDIILIDLSDTSNYPHSHTNNLDLESLVVTTDATSDAIFDIALGLLTDVDSNDGKFIEILRISAGNNVGAPQEIDAQWVGSGGTLKPEKWLSSAMPVLTGFSSSSQLASTLDLATANTNPADGDFCMRIIRGDSKQVTISMAVVYKSG